MNVIRALSAGTVSILSSLIIGAAAHASSIQDGANTANVGGMATDLFGPSGTLTAITNTLLFVVGALSVVMIIYGGIRYVVSGGNATSVTAAKNTILYAIVGLVVAFLAFAAINFVLEALTGTTPGTSR